jgi:hypothetical protein
MRALDAEFNRIAVRPRAGIKLALAGDATALRLCMERLVPPHKDRAVAFPLPPVTSAADAARTIAALIAAVAEGQITPSEAVTVAGLLEACRRAIDSVPAPAPLAPPPVGVTVTTLCARTGNEARGRRG